MSGSLHFSFPASLAPIARFGPGFLHRRHLSRLRAGTGAGDHVPRLVAGRLRAAADRGGSGDPQSKPG